MSNTQYAFLEREMVPDRDALQRSIDDLGFDLKLDPEYSRFEDEGFLPFTLSGEQGPGFEIYYEQSANIIEDERERTALAADRDWCISMVFRGSKKDLACVMIVSCALAKDFDAVVSFEGETPESAGALIEATRQLLTELTESEKGAETPSSDGRSALQTALDSLVDSSCELNLMMERLILSTESGARVMGGAWRARVAGLNLDASRYARVREEQIQILRRTDGKPGDAETSRAAELERSLESAEDLDASDTAALEESLPKVGRLRIASAQWDGNSSVCFSFKDSDSGPIEWFGIGTSGATVRVPSHGDWNISGGSANSL